jgi:hypothetical protein
LHQSNRAEREQSGDPDPNRTHAGARDTGIASRSKQRCYFILSTKSSGSSVLQRHLSALTSARLPTSHHEERETLFFTKAASVLGLPQVKLENSEVPYSPLEAGQDLQRFLEQNVGSWTASLRTEDDIFRAWTTVVRSAPEDLVEKSPHHLYEKSVVHLMERYADAEPQIDVRFIGLVRNPLATLCSSWRRFGLRPANEERHWRRAYRLLLDLQARKPQLVTIITYERLVRDPQELATLLAIETATPTSERIHDDSLERWRQDDAFAHHLSEETIRLAERFGYARDELLNDREPRWSIRDEVRASAWSMLYKLPSRPRRLLLWHGWRAIHRIRGILHERN